MRKLAKDIKVDDKMLSYGIINGLKSHISAYVTQQKGKRPPLWTTSWKMLG